MEVEKRSERPRRSRTRRGGTATRNPLAKNSGGGNRKETIAACCLLHPSTSAFVPLVLKEQILLVSLLQAIAIETHLRLGGGFVARQSSSSSFHKCARSGSSGPASGASARGGRRCRL